MTFANPLSALIAASIAVPLLLLLYILKLRRQSMRIPSTLLWRRSFEDLQVNVPFKKLRSSLMLLLQLLLLLVMLLAFAEPRLQVGAAPSGRMILLIDRSASMNTRMAGDKTRLEEAKEAARKIVEQMGRGGQGSEIMVLSFGHSAQVVSGFESNRNVLLDLIDSIEPTDEEANLDAALQLAGAFAGQGEEAAQKPPDVVLLSDGGVSRLDEVPDFTLRTGNFKYVSIGADEITEDFDNVGFAAFSARRDYEDPARVLVFCRLVNAGNSGVDAVVTLEAEGLEPMLRRVSIPPAQPDQPGEATLSFSMDLPDGASLRISHNHADLLGSDDQAMLIMPPPARPRIALVYSEAGLDPFLHDLIEAMQPQFINEMSLQDYARLDEKTLRGGESFDLVIFDRTSGMSLPGVPSLTMGGVPAGIDVVEPRVEQSHRILSWDRQHPVMRFVSLDTVVYQEFGAFRLPAGATPLAFGETGPILAVLRTRGARHVVLGFALPKSNWPVHISVTVFLQNVMDYLTLAGSVQEGRFHRPGEPITVRPRSGVTEISIEGPLSTSLVVARDSALTLPVLRRAGLYTVSGVATPEDRLAVSLLSEQESDIRPRSSIVVNASETSGARVTDAVPLELWPWLVGLGLVLLIAEWLLYCHRLRSMS